MITPLAAQAIGMAIHEMATNAGKYGALSNDTGHVNIAWGLERADAGGERFRMDWSESGGPTVVPPTRRGFGSTVINTMEYGLGGEVAIYYAPSGLMWQLTCPAAKALERKHSPA
jgi:two-component sensor histidine kinase